MITAALALVIGIQSSGDALTAVLNDDPETWSVEYPRLIQPYVTEYRGCLGFTIRYIKGVADFEAQHRGDIPRCEEERAEAIAASKAEMEGAKTPMSVDEIERLFHAIGQIHIQRGRDLDQQFAMRIEAAEERAAKEPPPRPKPIVIDLPDPSVVKTRDLPTGKMP